MSKDDCCVVISPHECLLFVVELVALFSFSAMHQNLIRVMDTKDVCKRFVFLNCMFQRNNSYHDTWLYGLQGLDAQNFVCIANREKGEIGSPINYDGWCKYWMIHDNFKKINIFRIKSPDNSKGALVDEV